MTAGLLGGVIVPIGVVILMTAVGLNLKLAAMRENLRHPRSLLIATLSQVVLLPLAALLLIKILAPPPVLSVAMFAVAISPGGALSKVFTHLARGNLALSVMMTVVTALAVSATAPVAVGVASAAGVSFVGAGGPLSAQAIAIDLVRACLLPICLGLLIARLFPAFVDRIRPGVDLLCVAVIVTVIVCSTIVAWPIVQESAARHFGYATALSLASIAAGACVAATLPAGDRSACTIEFGVRNLAIALLVAAGSNPSPEIVAFLLCYLVVNTLALLAVALLVGTWTRPRAASAVPEVAKLR
jgi:BASS family bile acid:Na+ symporter